MQGAADQSGIVSPEFGVPSAEGLAERVADKIGIIHKQAMLLVDALLRLPTVVGLLFFAVLLLRDEEWTLTTLIGALLALSLSALFLSNAPAALALPFQPRIVAEVLAVPNLALLWWFGRSLLDDDFQLGLLEWTGFLLLSAGNLPLPPEYAVISVFSANWGTFAFNALAFAVPAHLAFLAVTGWSNDLIQRRRRFRLFLLGWLIIGLSIILLVEDGDAPEHILALVRMAVTFPAVWLIILVSTQLRSDTGLTARARQIRKPLARDSAQNAALKRLMQAIESDLVYLDATLTIPELSKKCGVTEYQMRNLINGHLGFSNFSAFLNAYRIEEAKRRLTLSDEAITTIALDCGFQTLSTFNRAFRKIEGQAPTNYRQNAGN